MTLAHAEAARNISNAVDNNVIVRLLQNTPIPSLRAKRSNPEVKVTRLLWEKRPRIDGNMSFAAAS